MRSGIKSMQPKEHILSDASLDNRVVTFSVGCRVFGR